MFDLCTDLWAPRYNSDLVCLSVILGRMQLCKFFFVMPVYRLIINNFAKPCPFKKRVVKGLFYELLI